MDMTQPLYEKAKQAAVLVSFTISFILACLIWIVCFFKINIFIVVFPLLLSPVIYLFLMRRKAIEKVAVDTSPKDNYSEEEKQELIDFLKKFRI